MLWNSYWPSRCIFRKFIALFKSSKKFAMLFIGQRYSPFRNSFK